MLDVFFEWARVDQDVFNVNYYLSDEQIKEKNDDWLEHWLTVCYAERHDKILVVATSSWKGDLQLITFLDTK